MIMSEGKEKLTSEALQPHFPLTPTLCNIDLISPMSFTALPPVDDEQPKAYWAFSGGWPNCLFHTPLLYDTSRSLVSSVRRLTPTTTIKTTYEILEPPVNHVWA
jgi:hypothetical protein